MKKGLLFFSICIILSEVINPINGIIALPGPYSLGKWLFVLYGLSNIRRGDFSSYILLIPIGYCLSSLTSNSVLDNLLNSIGTGLLYLSGLGFMNFILGKPFWLKACYYILIGGVVYWSIYVIGLYLSGQVTTFYSFNSSRQNIVTVNHHVFGSTLGFGMIVFLIKSIKEIGVRKALFFVASLTCLSLLFLINNRATLVGVAIVLASILWNSHRIRIIKILLIVLFFSVSILSIFDSELNFVDQRIIERNSISKDYILKTNESRIQLYQDFFGNLSNFIILGKGPLESHLKVRGSERKYLAHNTYLSIIISGGILALISTFILIRQNFLSFKIGFSDVDIEGKDGYRNLLSLGFSSILVGAFFYDLGGLGWIFIVTYLIKKMSNDNRKHQEQDRIEIKTLC